MKVGGALTLSHLLANQVNSTAQTFRIQETSSRPSEIWFFRIRSQLVPATCYLGPTAAPLNAHFWSRFWSLVLVLILVLAVVMVFVIV